MRVDRGFSADRVLAVDVSLPSSRYDKAADRIAVYDRVLAAIRGLPGVDSVSWTSRLPLKGLDWADLVTVDLSDLPVVVGDELHRASSHASTSPALASGGNTG